MPVTYTTKSGIVKVKTTISIRKELYDFVRELAYLRFGGDFSYALEHIIETYATFRVAFSGGGPIIGPTQSEASTAQRSRKKNENNEETSPVEAEVATKLATEKLRQYLYMVQGFKQNLQRYVRLKSSDILSNLATYTPDFEKISRKLDQVIKDVEKIMKDKKVIKTQELLEIVDMLQKEVEEVRNILANITRP